MSEFDYKEDEAVQVGLERLNEETKAQVLGLEALREKVVQVGMSKGVYTEGEKAFPGVFATINPRHLTQQMSTTKQAVAAEAIDMHAAKLVGAGVAATMAAGGVGVLIYKFVKWVKSRLSSGAGDVPDDKVSTAAEPVPKEKVKESVDKKAARGKTKVEAVESGDAKKIIGGMSGNMEKVGFFFAYSYGSSMNESIAVLKGIEKSSLAKEDADVACLFVPSSGLPMAVMGAAHYNVDGSFVNEAYKYLGHVLKAFQALGRFMADPRDQTMQDVIAAAKGLSDANSHGSRVMVAIQEYGTDKAALFEGRVGYAHFLDSARVKYHPDQSEVKKFIDLLANAGYNDLCKGIESPYSQVKKLLSDFEAAGVKLEKDISDADVKEANEKAKGDDKLKAAVKDIQTSVSNALKLKQVLNRYINSVAVLKEQLKK